MKKISHTTLGCKVNNYDTQAVLDQFRANGYTIQKNFEDPADIYIINTCTITNTSDKKSRQMIRRARANNQNAIVVVMGCLAQIEPQQTAAIDGVNIVIGTNDRANIINIVQNYQKTNQTADIYHKNFVHTEIFEELKITTPGTKTRGFIKIQEGCNQHCSYCIIPHARGPNRSRNITHIIQEAKQLSAAGCKEIVITGIHITSYGADFGNINLINVIEQISQIQGIERIRLSSIEPSTVTKSFISAISQHKKVCNHFHISLQSGSDKILTAMNRPYTTTDFYNAVALLRATIPNVSITTDIITGFPGETEKDFNDTIDFVQTIGFGGIHIFPFSPKKGTPAYTFEGKVNSQTKMNRAKKLKQIEQTQRTNFEKSQYGKKLKVLYEKELKNNVYMGYSTNYIKVYAYSVECIENEIREEVYGAGVLDYVG